MKYYFVRKSQPFDYERLGTSRLGVKRKTLDIEFKADGTMLYPEPIKLTTRGEDGDDKIYFPQIQDLQALFLMGMTPTLKNIFEQFNMPPCKWYRAEAVYDIEYVETMKRVFRIDYDIDINEKRDYWILQILDLKRKELSLML
jgi:hypothetical protein